MSAFIERVESELARWAEANPEPENVSLAQSVGRLARALDACPIDASDYPEALRMLRRLVEPAPLTPITADDGWSVDRSYGIQRWYSKRWSRLSKEAGGGYIAFIEFVNGHEFIGVLCEVTLPFEVPEQPIQIAANARRDSALLFPAIAAAGFTPLEVMFSHEQA